MTRGFFWRGKVFSAFTTLTAALLALGLTPGGAAAVDGAWAKDQAARDDWFYRAPHVLSLAAKRIIASYYGSPPRHSYFNGCSNGGREALLLAQRYPTDFEGIIAAAPANYLGPLLGVYETWLARTNTAATGAPIITNAKLPALHHAVVGTCDDLDGLVDGQIDDPRKCRFDPMTLLPPALKPFGAVPPLVTDINLSVDDQRLYVSCWGTGELKQYDLSDPAQPRETGSVRLGGIAGRAAHPAGPDRPLAGGPQMVEVSRDGRRVYLTNSLYGAWDDRFYPDGVGAWMAKIDASTTGGLSIDEAFFPYGEDFRGLRVHQVRLQGGDASSDSYCYR